MTLILNLRSFQQSLWHTRHLVHYKPMNYKRKKKKKKAALIVIYRSWPALHHSSMGKDRLQKKITKKKIIKKIMQDGICFIKINEFSWFLLQLAEFKVKRLTRVNWLRAWWRFSSLESPVSIPESSSTRLETNSFPNGL